MIVRDLNVAQHFEDYFQALLNNPPKAKSKITKRQIMDRANGTEFMRMYDHDKSRYYIDLFNDKNKAIKKETKQLKGQGLDPKPLKTMSIHLKSDESWSKTAFNPKSRSHKFRDRIVFAGG